MDIRQLKYFLKIVEHGNMTRAAELLHVAQPALSLQMRNLEDELGVRLFHRTSNGVTPTEAGLILRSQGRQILRQLDDTIAMVRSQIDSPTGEVAIALPSSTASVMAIPLLQEVRSRYPGISIKFIELPSADLPQMLEAGHADMIIGVHVASRQAMSLVPLVSERLFLVERPNGNAVATKKVTMARLSETPLVLAAPPNTIRQSIDALFQRAKTRGNVVAEINSTRLMVQAVRAGVASTVLPLSAIAEDLESGKLTAAPLAGAWTTRDLALCTSTSTNRTIASKAVFTLIPQITKSLIDRGIWKGARTL